MLFIFILNNIVVNKALFSGNLSQFLKIKAKNTNLPKQTKGKKGTSKRTPGDRPPGPRTTPKPTKKINSFTNFFKLDQTARAILKPPNSHKPQ